MITPVVDPHHGQTRPMDDAEVKERSEKRLNAYLSFINDLEASFPMVEVCDDPQDSGMGYASRYVTRYVTRYVSCLLNFFCPNANLTVMRFFSYQTSVTCCMHDLTNGSGLW